MAKQTKEELLKAIAKLSPDEQKKLLEELEEKRSPSYNWQRDPFAIAEELS